jgi:hypothetical protein
MAENKEKIELSDELIANLCFEYGALAGAFKFIAPKLYESLFEGEFTEEELDQIIAKGHESKHYIEGIKIVKEVLEDV